MADTEAAVRPHLTGLVLAGGGSRRMGVDKASLAWGDGTLLSHACATLASFCDPVLVSVGQTRRTDVPDDVQVLDARGHAGPLAGIVAGLGAATSPLVAVLAVDTPLAGADLYAELVARWTHEPAVIPRVAGRLHPLTGVYAVAARVPLVWALADGRRAPTRVLPDIGALVLDLDGSPWADAVATNLNTPEDVARARARAH